MRLRLSRPEPEDDSIDLTPLIDCIFLLVLFFMLTASFIEEANVFKIVLPRADRPTTVARDAVDAISVSVDGRYAFQDASGRHPLNNLEELLDRLKQRDEASRQRPVVIRCDVRCDYGRFAQVKNAVKLAGVETIFEEVEVRR
jgi:biopolymer transport protein ExbD